MKFCAVICEYNPFHNGHLHLLEEIRRRGHEKILCLMSGNFTQRGEIAVFGKFTRARHAIECGADAVIELPAAFAVSPAELFARGAVHVLSALPVDTLAFGCESGEKEDFLKTASLLATEDKQFRATLKAFMKDGTSYIRARNAAIAALEIGADMTLLESPNNILGTEYCRSILIERAKIDPLPIRRVGSGYSDGELHASLSSAAAIRASLSDESRKTQKLLRKNLPPAVYADLSERPCPPFEQAVLCALLRAKRDAVAETPDCSEGLENRLAALAKSNPTYHGLLEKSVSKRYTAARIRRILLQNFLEIKQSDVLSFLSSPLYAKTLAVKREGAEETLAALAQGSIPILSRKSDYSLLKKDALACFGVDVRANDLYAALTGRYENEFQTLFV